MSPFVAERRNVKIIAAAANAQQNPYLLSEEEEKTTLRKQSENKQRLRVPRRPPWTKKMTTAQLDRQEKDAFLEWRRGLAEYVPLFTPRAIPKHRPTIPPTDCKIETNSFSRHSNAISRYGGNFGVYLNDRISSSRSSMRGIHYASGART